MRKLLAASLLLLSFISLNVSPVMAAEEEEGKTAFIMHHIKDAHDWHIVDIGDHAISIPLPIILITDGKLDVFSSGEFHHTDDGSVPVVRGENTYLKYHEKIYLADENGGLTMDADGHPTNAKPFNISITKNVASMLISVAIIFAVFFTVANRYKKNGVSAPKGVQSFIEPLVLFVRDEIAIPNIGKHHYKKFMPFLLTVFFFIFINNLLGLLPGAANLTGNIAITATLAVFTFIITTFSANKNYWKHIFAMPGVPKPLLLIMIPVEILGMFTKPVSLTIRLFANITAGHIIILSIIGLIFIFQSVAVVSSQCCSRVCYDILRITCSIYSGLCVYTSFFDLLWWSGRRGT